jgi:hypothetical protein
MSKRKEWAGPGPDGGRGYTAEKGLKAVLGGEGIKEMNEGKDAMTPEKMREYIMAAPKKKNVSYGDESRRFAKALLLKADKSKESFLKMKREDIDGFVAKEMKEGDYDLTGFMFGWAVNSVRYVLEAESSMLNPAIVTMDTTELEEKLDRLKTATIILKGLESGVPAHIISGDPKIGKRVINPTKKNTEGIRKIIKNPDGMWTLAGIWMKFGKTGK